MASNILVLSDMSADFDQFRTQMENTLSVKQSWIGNLTTQSSQTMIELISSVGTFAQSKMIRSVEDCFSETALSDDAIRSITQMQGLRMSRKLPSTLEGTITYPTSITLPPLSQFSVGGQPWFSRTQLVLTANTPLSVTLYQGLIRNFVLQGLGTDNQTFVSEEDDFEVSDQDVLVQVNDVVISKTFAGLWNNKNTAGYQDSTMPDGRLLVIFGRAGFGTVPQTNDNVLIRYPVTQGLNSNNQALVGSSIILPNAPDLTGIVTANPTGGANEQPIQTYKNLAAGSFGTYGSGVTKSQYVALVGTYPGVVDAYTQAQREINPSSVEWMNVIRVSALTSSPWSQQQKQDYLSYLQTITMYAPRFIFVDAIQVPRDIIVELYCFNTAVLSEIQAKADQAIRQLFAPKPGLLMTNFYESDLDSVCKAAAPGAISYVKVIQPESMVVTAPESPTLAYTVIVGSGQLDPLIYQYGMSSVINGEEGPPSNWIAVQVTQNDCSIQLNWEAIGGATQYKLWGRQSGHIGLIATIDATDPLQFIDDGSITPSGSPPNTLSEVPIRYNSINSLQITAYFSERQQRLNG